MMTWETFGTILGIVLGGQSLFETLRWFRHRHIESRKAETSADREEFAKLQEIINFLQSQLKDKEERFADQTQLVRKQNAEIIQLMNERARIELDYAHYKADMELQMERIRCEDLPCPFRLPPNAHTRPRHGMTKEEYHESKKNKSCEN